MKQRCSLPGAKLLIEFYFLRRDGLLLVSAATKPPMWVWGRDRVARAGFDYGPFVMVRVSAAEKE